MHENSMDAHFMKPYILPLTLLLMIFQKEGFVIQRLEK